MNPPSPDSADALPFILAFLLGLFTGASGFAFLALVMHRRARESDRPLPHRPV